MATEAHTGASDDWEKIVLNEQISKVEVEVEAEVKNVERLKRENWQMGE